MYAQLRDRLDVLARVESGEHFDLKVSPQSSPSFGPAMPLPQQFDDIPTLRGVCVVCECASVRGQVLDCSCFPPQSPLGLRHHPRTLVLSVRWLAYIS